MVPNPLTATRLSATASEFAGHGIKIAPLCRCVDVWVLKLRRGRFPVGLEIEWAREQVCLFLKLHGLRYPKKEVVVMVQGSQIKTAFRWDRGQPGWLSYDRPKGRERRGNQS